MEFTTVSKGGAPRRLALASRLMYNALPSHFTKIPVIFNSILKWKSCYIMGGGTIIFRRSSIRFPGVSNEEAPINLQIGASNSIP